MSETLRELLDSEMASGGHDTVNLGSSADQAPSEEERWAGRGNSRDDGPAIDESKPLMLMGQIFAATVPSDAAAREEAITCTESTFDTLELTIRGNKAKPRSEQCEFIRVSTAAVPADNQASRPGEVIVDFADMRDADRLSVDEIAAPVTFENIPKGLNLALYGTAHPTTVKFNDMSGPDDHAEVDIANSNSRFVINDIEHLEVKTSISGSVILSGDSLKSLTLKGDGLMNLVLSTETMVNLTSIDASAARGTFIVTAAETKPLEIKGSQGDDIYILAGNAHNTVSTGKGNDVVLTGGGNDTVDTGEGDDIISVGRGANSVTTGTGRDLLILSAIWESWPSFVGRTMTTIQDFDAAGGDRIKFRDLADGTIADKAVRERVQAAVNDVQPYNPLGDVVEAARTATEDYEISWFSWEGDTYVFADMPQCCTVRLKGIVDLTADNLMFDT
ncbi:MULTISPECIES: calcium-binding protein [unclassified Chelatococcus]|uniref:calcium-binding protein n=1 Tax=unclassified Chelatococcus TaxID=2638111 RepID=UPI001BCFEC55|nr:MULTISPECIES: calcium-binding protein [unclassified Chelatococcus]CAH1670251.1 hypothetical protein CHELA20_50609 [Hyphomicrobiales bacterium]MBS7739231.1 calcium-binding protein [Chelatococcus sp. HY11]MBX3543721.1 calcium-binding protein [Chelatococcus sp.]MCO5076236.1 calcium-binding protein [Chelatococcus sp.]CAH1677565.1 hypothetical protein CHELA41_24413 [Hyphomicrobiales bacterium]